MAQHGSHSSRLALEPLVLFLAAVLLPDNRARVWAWAQWSLIATCVPVAIYGLIQQALGVDGLLALGYEYGEQVRQINGRLRSFGTLDDAFIYSAVLTLGLALLIMGKARLQTKLFLGLPVALGLAAGLVRTSLLTCVMVIAVWLFSKHRPAAAAVLLCGALAIAGLVIARAEGTQTTTVATASGPLTLNGRASAWEAAVGGPTNWPLGRGPGRVGTGAQRASANSGATAAAGSATDKSFRAVQLGISRSRRRRGLDRPLRPDRSVRPNLASCMAGGDLRLYGRLGVPCTRCRHGGRRGHTVFLHRISHSPARLSPDRSVGSGRDSPAGDNGPQRRRPSSRRHGLGARTLGAPETSLLALRYRP